MPRCEYSYYVTLLSCRLVTSFIGGGTYGGQTSYRGCVAPGHPLKPPLLYLSTVLSSTEGKVYGDKKVATGNNRCRSFSVGTGYSSWYKTCYGLDRSYIHVQGGPKSKPQNFVHIFAKYWPIFKLFSLLNSVKNL